MRKINDVCKRIWAGVICHLHCKRESTTIGKQQYIALTIYILTMCFGMSGTLLGISGPQGFTSYIFNGVYVSLSIFIYVIYLLHKIQLPRAFTVISMLTQIATSIEMVLCAMHPTTYSLMLIVANTVLLSVNILFTLIAYLKYIPIILSFMSITVYLLCTFITGDASLLNFAVLFTLIFLNVAILSNRMIHNINTIKQENDDLRHEEDALLEVLKLKRSNVKAFVALVRKRNLYHDTARYLDILETESERNLIENVREFIRESEAEKQDISKAFPELSPSEIGICELILKGKKQRDICIALNKSASNISVQRSNIRRKLGLRANDDLRTALLCRLN